MSSGLASAVQFAGSLPGSILMILGQTLVLVCVCSDMVRVLSVPRSHRRYVANTVFLTLALPAILFTTASVVIAAASGTWLNVATGVFVAVVVIFRWRSDSDDDNWWKGKGKALGRWLRSRTAPRSLAAPAGA
ncbi:hypothetical protein E5206_04815 [Arthrobacter sp. PAMC25564]|uniref:hypothetical protein n=1 Tax=Arthrobacter sp. PAMC25564 TaxID=2565366 RepID=UPI0010A28277|nr:hypothetical protein [Arthrobacter sp. PAMC25564]QCB96331.1 hypothetical protein E5206_04815 [Arthrobacter sp. PAMC25564]